RAVAGQLTGLADGLVHLADGGDVAPGGGGGQRLDVPVDRARKTVEAARDVLPRLDRSGGHDVEDVAQVLHRRVDVVQLPQALAGLVQLELQADALAHRGQRDPVDVVDGFQPVQRRQHVAPGPGPRV